MALLGKAFAFGMAPSAGPVERLRSRPSDRVTRQQPADRGSSALAAAATALAAGIVANRRALQKGAARGVARHAEVQEYMDFDPEDWVKRVKMIEGERAVFDVTIPKPLGLVPANFPNRPGVGVAKITPDSSHINASSRLTLAKASKKPELHKPETYPWTGAWGGPDRDWTPAPPTGPRLRICRPRAAQRVARTQKAEEVPHRPRLSRELGESLADLSSVLQDSRGLRILRSKLQTEPAAGMTRRALRALVVLLPSDGSKTGPLERCQLPEDVEALVHVLDEVSRKQFEEARDLLRRPQSLEDWTLSIRANGVKTWEHLGTGALRLNSIRSSAEADAPSAAIIKLAVQVLAYLTARFVPLQVSPAVEPVEVTAVEDTGSIAAAAAAQKVAPTEPKQFPAELQKQLKNGSLRRAMLADVCLDSLNFEGHNLQEAFLENASFRKATLRRCRLEKASLGKANMTACCLEGANLCEAMLDAAQLGQANAVDANFADASLNGVSMRTSNLSRATFQHASLQRAVLANCRLEGSNFEDADMTGCILDGAVLSKANLLRAKLRSASLRSTRLEDCNLDDVDLSAADLHSITLVDSHALRAKLGKASLMKAVIKNAVLAHSYAAESNLCGAQLEAVDLTGANLTRALCRSSKLTNVSLATAHLVGISLDDAKIDASVFSETDLRQSSFEEASWP
eukprot:s3973_g8.t1